MTYPFLSDETIAAVSTPPGPGAIGMVRITGSRAHEIGRKIFTPAREGSRSFPSRRALFGRVHRPGRRTQPIDQAVLCYFEGPGTYTGEDTVEITTHGGVLIMRALLDAVVEGGARLAEPGEFTRRAFLNGRMDLSQAEAVASLIFASTEEARRVMLRQVEGAMGGEAAEIRECLVTIKASLEASIDFPEEAEEPDAGDLLPHLEAAYDLATRLMATAGKGIALGEGFRVVITGAPNVGKSCLLNTLLEENRAIVHEVAGTTRDYLEGMLNIEGIPIKVVDTAGLREAADPVEGQGVEKTRRLIEEADLLIVVLDGTREILPDELTFLEATRSAKRIIAVNKMDLPCAPDFRFPEGSVRISALEGHGIDALKRIIHDIYTGGPQGADLEKGVVTTVRQARALEGIRSSCDRIRTAIAQGTPPELVAVSVDEALDGLAELTGEVTTDEVLDEIFTRFCIGK